MLVKGLGVSSGISIAKAFVIKEEELNIKKIESNPSLELEKLNKAIEQSRNQIQTIKEKASKTLSEDKLALFDAHMMFLDDPEFIGSIESKIKDDKANVDYAINETVEFFSNMFLGMDNEYFKERAADIKDVGSRMVLNSLNKKINDVSLIDEEVILLAHDLTPSQTAVIDKKFVKGFATDIGGKTSHTAIIARVLELPGIVGAKTATKDINDGDMLIMDAINGTIHINPSKELLDEYSKKAKDFLAYKKDLDKLKNEKAITLDDHHVEMAANIGAPSDMAGVLENNAQAIGLYRSEFLYMGRDNFPTEDEQFESYKIVLEKMENKPVIIRTLDIGGDKNLSYFDLPKELNPFLGYRALRICLEQKEMFKTQLRAILRASSFGKARIMYPMVSSLEEIIKANEIVKECKDELDKENISYDKNIEIGIMVEIPSVAIIADQIAKHVDFFSIGTNDLCQYTLAVDRMNEKISSLYNPLHPAILKLVKMVIDASHKEGIFTGMCGEMASTPESTLILLGMGLDEFSMNAPSIQAVKKVIRSTSMKEAKEIAKKALTLDTAKEVQDFAHNELKKLGITVF
ncbi:MAG: phosphoenolpyruvate--protein phosphotransferase [Peptostreptococcaceae bacterium]|nr:phosphoenolpyruvate--protein phosphotransferase [Peptostreptococcaceae bacterium]